MTLDNYFHFFLMNALVYVAIDQGFHKGKMKVTRNVKRKKLPGFLFISILKRFFRFILEECVGSFVMHWLENFFFTYELLILHDFRLFPSKKLVINAIHNNYIVFKCWLSNAGPHTYLGIWVFCVSKKFPWNAWIVISYQINSSVVWVQN